MKIRDWYFQGWERRETPDGKSELVYTGEYYVIPGGLKTLLPVCAALTAALISLYAVVALLPTEGGRWHYAAIPQLLELIPLIYLVMGDVCLLRGKKRMTYRDWHASWRRVKLASGWSVGMTAAMAGVEVVYLALFGREGPLAPELLYLLGELSLTALGAAIFLFVRAHPCKQEI